jgi:hypothetical protein
MDREICWIAPDGRQYLVTLLREPFDSDQSMVFRCAGWIGVASVPADVTTADLNFELLQGALFEARS